MTRASRTWHGVIIDDARDSTRHSIRHWVRPKGRMECEISRRSIQNVTRLLSPRWEMETEDIDLKHRDSTTGNRDRERSFFNVARRRDVWWSRRNDLDGTRPILDKTCFVRALFLNDDPYLTTISIEWEIRLICHCCLYERITKS